MEKEKYIPISCSFYDRLEEWATLRKECSIEYLKLKSGEEIRLDYLISVNGEALPQSC